MNPVLHSQYTPEPQLSPIDTDTVDVRATVGLLASDNSSAPLLLSLKQIEKLVEQRVAVYVQRGIGEEYQISDYHFTEYGADIMEDKLPILSLSNIVLKYEQFSLEEIYFLKSNQIIISNINPEQFTKEMAHYLYERKITAVGMNFLNIENNNLQNIVNQLVSIFISEHKVKYMLQLNPLFLKGVYCYNGEICNCKVAKHADVPWKDLVELCWNLN